MIRLLLYLSCTLVFWRLEIDGNAVKQGMKWDPLLILNRSKFSSFSPIISENKTPTNRETQPQKEDTTNNNNNQKMKHNWMSLVHRMSVQARWCCKKTTINGVWLVPSDYLEIDDKASQRVIVDVFDCWWWPKRLKFRLIENKHLISLPNLNCIFVISLIIGSSQTLFILVPCFRKMRSSCIHEENVKNS